MSSYYVHGLDVLGGQQKVLGPLELKLQMAVSYPMNAGRTTSILNQLAISPAQFYLCVCRHAQRQRDREKEGRYVYVVCTHI